MRYTLVPDVHGRKFWRDAVKDVETTPVVFMGDYLDPYDSDGVKWSEAWKELHDIVTLKKKYPEQVTLLLGNHDVHYLPGYPFFSRSTRFSYGYAERIETFFKKNLELFDIAKVIPRADGKPFLLTHAGVLNSWIREIVHSVHPEIPEAYAFVKSIADTSGDPVKIARLMNDTLHSSNKELSHFFIHTLGCVPGSRGGRGPGSCVWADIHDLKQFEEDMLPNCIQIVGHTRQDCFNQLWFDAEGGTNAYCIDYGRAFTLEPGSSPFLRFKNELKTHFTVGDLAAAPELFIFGYWLWNLTDEAHTEAEGLIKKCLDFGKLRMYEEGAYYVWSDTLRLFRNDGEPDLPDWVVANWNRMKPHLPGMKPEDLMEVILGRLFIDKYHNYRKLRR